MIRSLGFYLLPMVLCVTAGPVECWAQLRVVTYNTLQGPNPGLSTVLEAIGEESYSGFAKPIDVLLLQEQNNITSSSGSTRQIVDILNNIYGPGIYDSGEQNSNPPFVDIRQGIIYNTQTVELVDEAAFGSINSSGQARQYLRYQLRPKGYDSDADFYAYNHHYKAVDSPTDEARRLVEAQHVRNNADALGQGTHVIYAGDFNMYRGTEDGFQELLSSGNGQAFDPINEIGNWNNNGTFAEWHTQSTCEFSCSSGFAGGGVDDRFDFQLLSGEFLDNEGLAYIPGSYHSFGNNGSTFNDAINVGNTISFSGVTSFTDSQVVNALSTASDHLPVVADYQIPAFMEAELASSVPAMLDQGVGFSLDLLVRNAADVVTALGADELDFTFTTTGDLSGSGAGTALALGSDSNFPIVFDTSTQGSKSGAINISTTSQGAANSFISIPVTFQVGEGDPVVESVIARALFPTVADDINVSSFQFGGGFITEAPPSGGSDARYLAFSSSSDWFGFGDRNDSLPGEIVDNSATQSDTFGIIRSGDFDNVFGVVDIDNNNNSGPLTAEWKFDISSAVGGLGLSIDMAAMGDFEAVNDSYVFEVSIDGAPFTTLFQSSVDEAGSLLYTLEGGITRTEPDPLFMDGVQLNNLFQTFTQLVSGTGNELTLRFTAESNGAPEAFVFRNILVEGLVAATLTGDYNGDGTVDLADYTIWRNTLGDVVDNGTGADGNGNGVIDVGDYTEWKANFGNSSMVSASQQVPEPASVGLFLLSVGTLALWRAHRP